MTVSIIFYNRALRVWPVLWICKKSYKKETVAKAVAILHYGGLGARQMFQVTWPRECSTFGTWSCLTAIYFKTYLCLFKDCNCTLGPSLSCADSAEYLVLWTREEGGKDLGVSWTLVTYAGFDADENHGLQKIDKVKTSDRNKAVPVFCAATAWRTEDAENSAGSLELDLTENKVSLQM